MEMLSEHRITVTITGFNAPVDESMEKLLAGFERKHPEVGAVVGGNDADGTIDVTFALDAADWEVAASVGRPVFMESYQASGLPNAEVKSVFVERVPAEDLEEFADCEPALA